MGFRTRVALDRFDALAIAWMAVVVSVLFGPLLNHLVRGTPAETPYTDHPAHNAFAARMRQEGRVTMPHPLYHAAVTGIQSVIDRFQPAPEPNARAAMEAAGKEMQGPALAAVNARYATASVVTLLAAEFLAALVVWWELRRAVSGTGAWRTLFCAVVALTLLLVGPVSVLHAFDGKYYFGYVGIHVWHSPTVMVAKPLALLSFGGALWVFREPRAGERPGGRVAALAVVVVLGALAKPSFLMCLIPASLVVAAVRAARHDGTIQWTLLLGGLLLPAAVVLAWQSRMYAALTGGSHAVFKPFATMASMSDHLAVKFVLSVLFPVVCFIAWPEARGRFRWRFAWLVFAFGLMLTYLVAESRRTAHGNFLWSAQLALFVLFVESALATIAGARERWGVSRRGTMLATGVCSLAFAAHLAFGILYFAHLLGTPASTPLAYK